METIRKALYKNILSVVKNSPIVSIPFEGNTYHFKLDYKLPYGECHYARVFAKLLYYKECLGIIKQGDVLLETTSGSGGRAAAAIATALGYQIKIAIPAGGEHAREQSIINAGGELYLTPAERYVNGFPEFIRTFLTEHPGTKYINHAMGDIYGRGVNINEVAISSFRPFVDEVIESGIMPNIVVCPLGNGTTTLPMVTGFKALSPKMRVVGFESVASAFSYRRKYDDKYQREFGINPELLPRHDLPGTSPSCASFPMPALEACIPMLDSISLVTSTKVDNDFINLTGELPKGDVIAWDTIQHSAMNEFGRTGRAGFAVALDIARREKMKGVDFLIPVFDAAWHYDT